MPSPELGIFPLHFCPLAGRMAPGVNTAPPHANRLAPRETCAAFQVPASPFQLPGHRSTGWAGLGNLELGSSPPPCILLNNAAAEAVAGKTMPPDLRSLLLALLAATLALAAGCAQQPVKSLGAVEVRGYNGTDLSSINDFRENSIHGPQQVGLDNYTLAIYGLVDRPASLTYGQVLARQAYSKVVTLDCVEGWSVTILWEGVSIAELLGEAGVKPGANTVIFHCYDGYTTSLPLDYIRGRDILLAYSMNNVTIPPERGFPFIVVAEDKWGYKWAKWVTAIEVVNDPEYRGYWESRGYSANGDVNGSMFG